jgi:hypothetical protein
VNKKQKTKDQKKNKRQKTKGERRRGWFVVGGKIY